MNVTRESWTSPVTFRFSNIGPVKDAPLRLGELTVIAGRNNTGKTYIAYSLYGFLKGWMDWPAAEEFIDENRDEFPQVDALRKGIRNTDRAEVPVPPSKLARHRELLAREVGGAFSSQFRNVFNSRRDSFRDAALSVEFDAVSNGSVPSYARLPIYGRTFEMRYNGRHITASANAPDQSAAPMYSSGVVEAYFVFLMRDLFPDPFILSAERFGISLFYRELDFTKNQIVDLLQKYASGESSKTSWPFLIVDRTTSRYATPIKDNIDFTRSIPDLPHAPSPLADYKLFDHITEMMGGHYNNTNNDIWFSSNGNEKRHFNIPLHLASSSVRGLSDLYFFLRYATGRGQLLIIDEPESHLDTANQIQFARLLARFVNAGLRVVITTHSDYIVRELNNLIMLSRGFSEKDKVTEELKYRPDDELRPQSVRAYVAEDGGLTQCSIGPYGIDMPVFDRTLDNINRAAIQLSSRVEEEADE